MSARFAELDWQQTPLGAICLRRRTEPRLGVEVYEVKLDDEFLMSSLFTVAEVELARRGLALLAGTDLDVVVGGLGLGYTARAVLDDARVRSMSVVEVLPEVIDWHRRDLVPGGATLVQDPRTRLVADDFFAVVAAGEGERPWQPGVRFHAVLLDVDHSPRHLLHPAHARFYTAEGLHELAALLHDGGVFGLWADGRPDGDFLAVLGQVFEDARADVVEFANFYTGGTSSSTVYLAR
ncbi:spermidine synthase [Angustibacter sp. McL0619]|uniref:spermidine synthase n=1 Tax=Angustibacter sp. McL0619 TaxID=3415676 RepID=UPI003CE9CE4B